MNTVDENSTYKGSGPTETQG